MTTSYHHGDLRAALLARAEAVVEQDGVDALSLRALARDVGVSHAAPARHFRDRQALVDALAAAGFARMTQELAAASRPTATGPADVWDRLAAVARAYADFATSRPGLLSVMYASKHAEDADPALLEAGHACLQVVVDLVADGQADGSIADGDPVELSRVAFAAVHGVASLSTGGLLEDLPLDVALDRVVAVLVGGLRADRQRADR